MYFSSPSPRDVEIAIEVLGIDDEKDANNIRNFYKRERVQNREANVKLLKAIGRVLIKSAVILLIIWAFFQTWTERIPKNNQNGIEAYSAKP